MTNSTEERITDIVERASDLQGEARRSFVANQCAGDDDLHRAVSQRLSQASKSDRDPIDDHSEQDPPKQTPTGRMLGRKIGHLTLERPLGAGGMGEVYVAFDERLERRVAVKAILASQRLNAEIRGRFEREAKILSQLEHPHICRVYDYFTVDDADFIVLELINGVTLTDAQKGGLGQARKLEIALQIADGLETAHAKQIVHRDLKPGNVMIAERGEAKILDFGLARPVGSRAGNRAPAPTAPVPESSSDLFETTFGQVIGTPMFMSPEQTRGKSITAASDMFSFGLLLQWLFTESTPYPEGLSAFEIMVRAGKADTRPVQGLDGDLTRLIKRLKSLEPEYRPTAKEARTTLLDILEAPRRRMRRIVAVGFIALLVLGLLGTTLGLIQAKHAEEAAVNALQTAESEAAKARETIALLQEFLSSPDPTKAGIDIKVTELIEGFKPKLAELSEHPEVRAAILHTFGKTLDALGESDEAMTLLEEAVEIRLNIDGEDHPDTLDSQHALALTLYHVGFMVDAELLWQEVLEKRKTRLGPTHPDSLSSMFYLAAALDFLGHLEEAQILFEENLDSRRQVLGPRHPDTLTSLSRLSANYRHQGRFQKSESMERQCLDIRREALGDDHPDTLMSMSNLAKALWGQDKDAEAEPLSHQVIEGRRRVLGPLHPYTRYAMMDLRRALRSRGRDAEADALEREIEAIRRQSGSDMALIDALHSGGQSALDLVEERLHRGDGHEITPSILTQVSDAFLKEGNDAQAIASLEMGLSYFPDSFWTYVNLGDLHHDLGNKDRARAYYEQAESRAPRNRYVKRRLKNLAETP